MSVWSVLQELGSEIGAFVGELRNSQTTKPKRVPVKPAHAQKAKKEDDGRGEEAKHVSRNELIYWVTLLAVPMIIIVNVWIFPELTLWIAAPFVLYVLASVQVLQAGELGPMFVFGIATKVAGPGIHIVLLGIMEMPRLPEYPPQDQLPADPEHVYHDDDKLDLPIHPDGKPMVRPLRLLTGPPREGYKNKLLNTQITTKATGTIRWRIGDAFDFWVRHPGISAVEKIEEARKQLNDTWLKAVKSEWGKRPAGLIIDEDDEIHREVKKQLDKDVEKRGIDIYELTVLHPDLGHGLSTAISGVAQAFAKRDSDMAASDATAYDTKTVGAAAAEAHLAMEMADIEADGMRVEKMGITGREMFAADTAARVIGKNDKVLFGAAGLGEAVAAGFTIIDALNPKEKKEGEPA